MHRPSRVAATIFVALVSARALSAQAPADNPAVRAALASLKTDNAWTIAQQRSICEIAAPSFKEAARAAEMKRRFQALGLTARIDAVGNVIAERPGAAAQPTVVIAGHLDTVFPEGTDVKVKQDGARLHSPGIGDDCRGLAVVLAVARAYQQNHIATTGRVIFVADVGEEGAGDLRGMRNLFNKEMPGKIGDFISVDGIGTNMVTRAVGSHRYRITYKGPGGHSFGAFGTVNPIHALGRAIALISDLQVPATPKTTFNVGMINGGTSVNAIAGLASMDVDMRSESASELNALDGKVRHAVQQALDAENARWPASSAKLTVTVDTIGIRPTGTQADSSHIVRIAMDAGRSLGFTPHAGSASTDANIPISLGIPAITIDGGGRGGGTHALTEWYEDGPNGWLGPQWATLIVAELAGVQGAKVQGTEMQDGPLQDGELPPTGTFSIIAYDTVTGEWGGAVQSRVFSVGNGVLWGEAGVGMAATQAVVDVSYGPQALALLRQGMSAAEVVKSVWEHDPDPDTARWSKQGRQFAVVDSKGNVAAYTGPKATTYAGDRQGPHVTVQGNILAGPGVVDSMLAAYERTTGHLAFRLLAALEAGQAAGGDARGKQSAAMLIVKKCGGVWLHNDVVLRLQVDDNPEPIAELRRLVQKAPLPPRNGAVTNARNDPACR